MVATQSSLRTQDSAKVLAIPLWVYSEEGCTRLKSKPNIYKHNALKVFIYADVDDIITVGVEEHIQDVMSDISN